MCDCVFRLKDTELPRINRVAGNIWEAKYFQALVELRKANKGASRLRRSLDRLRERT
jgi:hypothetical protein